jgi:hypothetical protein
MSRLLVKREHMCVHACMRCHNTAGRNKHFVAAHCGAGRGSAVAAAGSRKALMIMVSCRHATSTAAVHLCLCMLRLTGYKSLPASVACRQEA